MTIINSAESLYLSLPSVGVISRECIIEYDYQEVVCVIGRQCIVEYDYHTLNNIGSLRVLLGLHGNSTEGFFLENLYCLECRKSCA